MASGRVGRKTVAGSVPSASASQGYLFSLSARTLILGVDQTGRILQYDRTVPRALGLTCSGRISAIWWPRRPSSARP